MIASKVTEMVITKYAFYIRIFFRHLIILSFTKVEIQINQLQQDSLGKSKERTLVSKLEILAHILN